MSGGRIDRRLYEAPCEVPRRAPSSSAAHAARSGGERVSETAVVRDLRIYLAATAFCVLFSVVYEHFSHGVYSAWMMGLALVPLLLGVLPNLAVRLAVRHARRGAGAASPAIPGGQPRRRLTLPAAHRAGRGAWGTGVLALTLGCCFSGVLEIYGTGSPYVPVFWVVGAASLLVAAVLAARAARRPSR